MGTGGLIRKERMQDCVYLPWEGRRCVPVLQRAVQ